MIPKNQGHSGAAFVWMPPHGGYWEAGGSEGSYLLQIDASGYASRILNLRETFKASGLKDRNGGKNIFEYGKEFSLGEILLDEAKKKPSRAPQPTAPSGRGSS